MVEQKISMRKHNFQTIFFENYNKQLEFQTMRKNEAHQGVLDMYNTNKADERFILQNVKFDELFNADGSINEYAHEAAKAVLENMENGSQYVQTFLRVCLPKDENILKIGLMLFHKNAI